MKHRIKYSLKRSGKLLFGSKERTTNFVTFLKVKRKEYLIVERSESIKWKFIQRDLSLWIINEVVRIIFIIAVYFIDFNNKIDCT